MRLRFTLLVMVLVVRSSGQQTVMPVCGNPPAVLKSTAPNIFSEQQEQWLGEAMADADDAYHRPVRNAAENAYLTTIGNRLLAALPPTRIQFHFSLVESPDINGYSLAGGQVHLTRKLVAVAHNEDEIAGVIAHEMGHILSHQFAIETTADLRRLLGVTSVTDRADVYAKYQRLTDARMTDKHPIIGESDEKQDEADRVAVYAAAAAGYRPQAYAEFWDRSFFVDGKTGNRVGDFFGTTKPNEKRLRLIRGIVAELPAGCGATTETASTEFKEWQHTVLEDQAAAPTAIAANSTDLQLDPPLHLSIERVRFSRDGRYILAQDEGSIFVLTREPFKTLFRFDADHALSADFSPDSEEIVFQTNDLHVEHWNVAQQKLVAAHEILSKKECLEARLSPDGRTQICVSYHSNDIHDLGIDLDLIDVDTGQTLFERRSWFEANFWFARSLYSHEVADDRSVLVPYSVSADGNLLLIGPSNVKLAFDLRNRTPIRIGDALKSGDYAMVYSFIGNDRILAINSVNFANSGIFTFPEGQRVKQIKLGFPWMRGVAGGKYLIAPGPDKLPAGVADLDTGRYVYATRNVSLDVFGTSAVSEEADGSLTLASLVNPDRKTWSHATLPVSALSTADSVSLSPDGRYLALSTSIRGSIWDLTTGKQTFLVVGFHDTWWTGDGKLLAQFPTRDKDHPATVTEMTVTPHGAKDMTYKPSAQAYLQSGHFLEWTAEKNTHILNAHSTVDYSVQWTRRFENIRPSYTTNNGDTDLIFSYSLQEPIAKDRLREDGTLAAEANNIKEKTLGRLVEIVDSKDGATRAQAVIEVPRSYRGVIGFNHAGDLLYLTVGDNRTIVYSMQTGAQLRQLYGFVGAIDSQTGLICTGNRRNEAIVLDKTGAEVAHFNLDSPIRFGALRDAGTHLIILTANQRIHRFTLAQTTPGAPSSPKAIVQ